MTRQKPANPLTLALPPVYARDLADELHGAAERHTRAVRTAAAELDAQDGDNRAPAVHIARALAVAARLEHIADAIAAPIGLAGAFATIDLDDPAGLTRPAAIAVELTELLGPANVAALGDPSPQPALDDLGRILAVIPRILGAPHGSDELEEAIADLAELAEPLGIDPALADDDADPVTDPPTGARWVDTATGEAVDPPDDDPAAALAELEDVGTP